jgi:hypothetical protein
VKNKLETREKWTKAIFNWDVYVKPKCNCLAIIYHVSSCNGPYVVFEKSSRAKIYFVFAEKPKW